MIIVLPVTPEVKSRQRWCREEAVPFAPEYIVVRKKSSFKCNVILVSFSKFSFPPKSLN